MTWRRIAPRAGILSIAERIRHLLKGLGFVPFDVWASDPEQRTQIRGQPETAMDKMQAGGDHQRSFAGGTDSIVEDLQQLVAEPFCLGLFGEFSAGKSSLSNLLISTDMLPTSVLSSTRVPTRLCHAADSVIHAILNNGERQQLMVEAAKDLDHDGVSSIEIGLPNELLRYVELLDTPGFSDPYHDPDRTQEAAASVHIGLWCTLATQAWRHSEQVIWTSLPEHLRTTGLLVVTHQDTLQSERDRKRVMTRLKREAGDFFHRIVMISVPDAIRARAADGSITDPELWRASGGETLIEALLESLKLAMAEREQVALEVRAGLSEIEPDDSLDPPTGEMAVPAGETVTTTAGVQRPDSVPGNDVEDVSPEEALGPAPVTAEPTTSKQPAPSLEKIDEMLARAVDSIQACHAAAYVDLAAGQLLRLRTADNQPLDGAEKMVGFATSLFQGANVRAIEQRFEDLRGEKQEGRHYFQEIIISGDELLCLLMRGKRLPTRIILIVVDGSTNMGLAMVKSRMIMAAVDGRA